MKYPKLAALVPQDEHFDQSAITGEGVWLSTAHVQAIENHLETLATSNEKLIQTLETANNSISELNSTIEGMNTAAGQDKVSITELNNQLAALQEENKILGGQSSGTGTALEVTEDEKPVETRHTKLTLNSADHPLNVLAARRIAAKNKK